MRKNIEHCENNCWQIVSIKFTKGMKGWKGMTLWTKSRFGWSMTHDLDPDTPIRLHKFICRLSWAHTFPNAQKSVRSLLRLSRNFHEHTKDPYKLSTYTIYDSFSRNFETIKHRKNWLAQARPKAFLQQKHNINSLCKHNSYNDL